jgi:hypothetical protein
LIVLDVGKYRVGVYRPGWDERNVWRWACSGLSAADRCCDMAGGRSWCLGLGCCRHSSTGRFSNGSGTVRDCEHPPPDHWIMNRPMNIWFHQRGAARKMLDIYVEDQRVSAADLADENLWELAQQYVGSLTDDELRAELLRTTLCYYDGLRAWSEPA